MRVQSNQNGATSISWPQFSIFWAQFSTLYAHNKISNKVSVGSLGLHNTWGDTRSVFVMVLLLWLNASAKVLQFTSQSFKNTQVMLWRVTCMPLVVMMSQTAFWKLWGWEIGTKFPPGNSNVKCHSSEFFLKAGILDFPASLKCNIYHRAHFFMLHSLGICMFVCLCEHLWAMITHFFLDVLFFMYFYFWPREPWLFSKWCASCFGPSML